MLSQSAIEEWAKDVRIVVEDVDHHRLKNVSVKFIVSNKNYYAKYVEKNSNYRFDSIPILKGKLRIDLKGYDGQNREFLPMSYYKTMPIVFQNKPWSWQYMFTLGKTGCSYTVRSNRLIPFTDFPGFLGLKYDRNKLDSVLQFLQINNFKINTHYTETATMIISFKQKNNAQNLKTLIEYDHILYAGRPYGQGPSYSSQHNESVPELHMGGSITGFFHNSFSINFRESLNNKLISKKDRELLLEKYNLEKLPHNLSRFHTEVKIKGNHSEINTLMIRLRNEPIVNTISSSLHAFEKPKID